MSAIFGLLASDRSASGASHLALMDAALAADGPDGGGMWADGPVALGHRLMSFGADGADRQPLVAHAGRLALVVDGRVDNRAELASALGIAARQARELSDVAYVLRAYERWGEGCVDRLVGEFAFALWDARKGRLVVVRSAPLGRPIFFRATPHRVWFASRPGGLFALPGIDREVDEEKIAGFLATVGIDQGASFFRAVRRLLPGQMVIVDRGTAQVKDRWDPPHQAEIGLGCDEDHVAAFTELFDRVLADQLRGEPSAGILLSGGLDSGSVAAGAAALLGPAGGRLTAYTEVPPSGFKGALPPGRYADETPFVQALAAMYPHIDPRFIVPGGRGLLHEVDDFFATAEMPFGNAANRGWIDAIYERAASDGVRLLLNGDHGNLTVSWEGAGLLSGLLRQLRLVRAVREARASARSGRSRSAWRALAGQGLRPLLPMAVSAPIARLLGSRPATAALPWEAYTLINPEFAATHRLAERIREDRAQHLSAGGRDYWTSRRDALVSVGALGSELFAGYRARYGIETRSPLADRRLVEFTLALPEDQHARRGETRLLIRRAMAHRLPPEMLHNRLRGLQAPDWFERMTAEREVLVAEVARFERDGLTSRVLDLPRLRALLEHWPTDAPTDPATTLLYRGGIGRALMSGRFLLWAQRSQQPVARH